MLSCTPADQSPAPPRLCHRIDSLLPLVPDFPHLLRVPCSPGTGKGWAEPPSLGPSDHRERQTFAAWASATRRCLSAGITCPLLTEAQTLPCTPAGERHCRPFPGTRRREGGRVTDGSRPQGLGFILGATAVTNRQLLPLSCRCPLPGWPRRSPGPSTPPGAPWVAGHTDPAHHQPPGTPDDPAPLISLWYPPRLCLPTFSLSLKPISNLPRLFLDE